MKKEPVLLGAGAIAKDTEAIVKPAAVTSVVIAPAETWGKVVPRAAMYAPLVLSIFVRFVEAARLLEFTTAVPALAKWNIPQPGTVVVKDKEPVTPEFEVSIGVEFTPDREQAKVPWSTVVPPLVTFTV